MLSPSHEGNLNTGAYGELNPSLHQQYGEDTSGWPTMDYYAKNVLDGAKVYLLRNLPIF